MSGYIYDHVAVIGIDGMGNFNRFANTPVMDKIFADGATNEFALSMDPTISAENWGAMLIGASPVVHGLTNSRISHNEYTNKALPSVFTRLRRIYPDAYLASVVNWNPINYGIVEHDVGVELVTASNDDELTPEIIKVVEKKPKFLFVQYDDVDGAGHGNGYGTENHLKRIEYTDGLVGEIYAAYEKAGIIDTTLFIVIADHGGIRRGHGGYTDEEHFVFFGASGKSVKKGTTGMVKTKDIAAIVLYALGAEVPAYDEAGFSSQIPENLFEDCSAGYIGSEPQTSQVECLPSPGFNAENGLASFIEKDRIKLAAFFDNEIKDESGCCEFKEYGRIKYYSNGVRSSCGEFGMTGCAKTNGLEPEINGSFTVAVWLKAERSTLEECVICSTKPWWWRKRSSAGFSLVMKNNDTVICVADGEDDISLITPFPDSFLDGWIHVMYAIDKEKKEIRVYYDFKFIRSFPLEDRYCERTITNVFVIGDDSELENNTHAFPNIFRADDLIILDGADEKDAEKLAEYYGK